MNIGILGAGTWGIALAKVLCENGHSVTVWSALSAEIDELSDAGKHKNLPGVSLPSELRYTKTLSDAFNGEYVIFAVASSYIREVARAAAPFLRAEQVLIDAAKGLESGTLFSMTEVIADEIKKQRSDCAMQIVALSGPTHAEEVALNMPTSIVSACADEKCAEDVAKLFTGSCMRVYTNTDIKGVELCGALKNIIAMAAGMARGMGYGDNTAAMLMTRGIAEITRMGLAMGCRRRTFMGLAGIGDLIVTCTSRHSRNNCCGEYIGQGMSYKEASEKIGEVVEGYYALEAAMELSKKYEDDLPLISAVYDIIKNGRSAAEVLKELMSRSLRSELE